MFHQSGGMVLQGPVVRSLIVKLGVLVIKLGVLVIKLDVLVIKLGIFSNFKSWLY